MERSVPALCLMGAGGWLGQPPLGCAGRPYTRLFSDPWERSEYFLGLMRSPETQKVKRHAIEQPSIRTCSQICSTTPYANLDPINT